MASLLVACGGGQESAKGPTVLPSEAKRLTIRAGSDAAVTARYVRLVATSEVNGNPWTSVAEFNVLDATGALISRGGWTVAADSQELVGENAPATNAIDGSPGSFWHTQWQGGSATVPHTLTIDLGTPQSIGGFKYLPRQIGENGRIASWLFFTSTDGTSWTLTAQGTFANSPAESTVMFAAGAAPNRSPVLSAVSDRTDVVGAAVTQALTASDEDGDTLTFSATGLPTGVTINATSGSMSGTPTTAGTFSVVAQASDGRGGTALASFTWTVSSAAAGGTAVVARYVRLVATAEVNGNPWTSVAELNVLDAAGRAISRDGWTVSADSQEEVGESAPATHAIDGDPHSFWHTQWQGASPPLPHALTIDLGALRNVGGFKYLPRQVGVNGRIASWQFHTSADGSHWTLAAQGSFPDGPAEATVAFAAGTTPTPPSPARTARIAAFASGPLVAGTPWRASEPVTTDTVRRLASGEHLAYTAAGVTGTVEPEVIDGRPVADGTATGYLNGRRLSATQPNAPIVSTAANATAAGLIQTTFAAGDFAAPRYAAVQGCKSLSTGSSFIGHYCFANGPAGGSGNATSVAAGTYGAGLSADYVYHANTWEEEFVVTDRYFGIVFANSVSPINVEIDGVQVQAGPAVSTGNEGWTLTFDYQGVVKRRTVRVISAAGSVAPVLRGVALTAQGSVLSGTTSADQVLILGDSINATVTPPTEAGTQMMSYWIQRYLGFGGAINMAVGGSGYVSQNTNSFNLPNLLANPANRSLIASYAPGITHVIIGAGFNDRTRPVAEVQAAALASWRALRALLPNAKISITDGWSGSSGPDANALALAAALTTTFVAWGDGNSRLIHSIGASPSTAYVNGTGNAGTPVTAGNSSVYTSTDGSHPSPAGARYLARRLSDDIVSAWGSAY